MNELGWNPTSTQSGEDARPLLNRASEGIPAYAADFGLVLGDAAIAALVRSRLSSALILLTTAFCASERVCETMAGSLRTYRRGI